MNRLAFTRAPLLSLLIVASACGAESPSRDASEGSDTPVSLSERLHRLDRDLTLGARGEDVRAVHEYLEHFGYFPNERLAARYPTWRSILAGGPERADAYDSHTATAVRELQGRVGLHATGVVDAPTRAHLKLARCGNPESLLADPSEKFASDQPVRLAPGNVTYALFGFSTDELTLTNAKLAMGQAVATWAAPASGVTFSEVHFSANPDILFAFDFLDGPSNELARASSIGNKFTLQFDTAETWSTAWPTPAGHIDFNTVAIHEVGHTLGLRHSSIEGATMYPVPGASSPNSLPLTDRTLATDDWVGASASYDKWQQLPGCATDVGVGTGGGVWVTGCGAVPGGFSIHQLTGGGTTWTSAPGGAVRIAVGPDNVPWITNDQGVIFRRTSSSATSGSWQILPGCAKDIGVGADGSAWVVGCNPVSDGHAIYKWNGSAFVQSGNQGAKAIAVGAGGEPWIVTDSALMFRRSTNSPTSGSWLPLPGTGHDIGINPGNYAWSTGGAVVPGGLAIQLYNEQDGVAGVADAPALNRWLRIPGPLSANGGAMRVSVGSAGNPYVIHIDGRIFRAM